jgi:hypothetical protein
MNFKESAYYVLKEEGKPLSARTLTELVLQKHLVTSVQNIKKTPHMGVSTKKLPNIGIK